MTATYTLPIATTSTLGGVIVDGTTITISQSGVISAASSGSFNNASLTGTTTIQHPAEIITTLSGATGTVAHDFITGSNVFYHTGVISNFTANFTNYPTNNNTSYTTTLIIQQGSTPYIPYAVSINNVSQNLYWTGTVNPTGNANKIDSFTFNLLYTNNAWIVTGSWVSYG
jgi:hypothetical protein